VPNVGLENTYVISLLKKRNEEHLAIISKIKISNFILLDEDNTYILVLTPLNWNEKEGAYVDQKNTKRVHVDHYSLRITKVEDI